MRITHLNTYGVIGGAARAAYRLHQGLCAAGHESRMLALYKSCSDPTVLEFMPPRDIATRLRRRLKRQAQERAIRELAARPRGSSPFSDDRSQHGADVLQQLPESDVLNLHWIAEFIDYRSFFQELPQNLPVVWTLHDMNAFTGGCHYDGGCGKFAGECGACPQLGSSYHRDLSERIWQRKRTAFDSLRPQQLHLVTPSRWLAEEVRRSALLRCRVVTVIPNGVDVGVFQPRDRLAARRRFGIPREARTVLFVADSAAEKRKGLTTLLEALKGISKDGDLLFIALGSGLTGERLGDQFKTMEPIHDESDLSFLYSAADVFVLPSLQDNLPNTAIEALACGIPTIGSNVGGIAEVIRAGRTGLVFAPGDSDALKQALVALLGEPQRRAWMAEESRRIAEEEYSSEVQARRYVDLYESMIGASPSSATR